MRCRECVQELGRESDKPLTRRLATRGSGRPLDGIPPLAGQLDRSEAHQVVLGPEVVADRTEVRPGGGSDVPGRGVSVALLDQALLRPFEERVSLIHTVIVSSFFPYVRIARSFCTFVQSRRDNLRTSCHSPNLVGLGRPPPARAA